MTYSASFTAGGILFNEFEAILPFIQKEGIKDLLANEVMENKYLKINSESARKRVIAEIRKRMEFVNMDFWVFYETRKEDDRKLLLFYLCIKTYQLLWDFHFKITIPGYWAYHHQLDDYAYKMYLDELESKDETVQSWSVSTRRKCITNYIRMLKDGGLLINKRLHKPDTENDFYCYFIKSGEGWAFDIYLLNNTEKEMINNFCQ